MSTQFDGEKILGKLKTHRKNILLELYQNGELYTGELREAAGVPAGSKNYHLELLQEWGLIELVGRADDGERVFKLTEKGREFVDEHLGDSDQGLEQRIAELEREVEALKEEKANRDDMKEYLTETYWQDIEDEIERQIGDGT